MGRPLVIAHRGYSDRAPGNTLAAFRLGWECGADGVECDVQLTKDGKVVCIHDLDTNWVANEKIKVADASWQELRSLDVGSWKDSAWEQERIPLLKEAIGEGPANLRWVIEIKCGDEIVKPLMEVLEGLGQTIWERIIVISFKEKPLIELKRRRPSAKAYWLSELSESVSGSYSPSVERIISNVERLGVDGFGGQSGQGISQELCQALVERGLELNVWTVDDEREALRMAEIGVTSITTNDPKRILNTLLENS
ncbi:MAG: glycerophosphodiester phosphodiesterase [Opitutaceae bacterium]|nr:glycerophosphodiester phosphodiesterase [Opitutaceae bacterium]